MARPGPPPVLRRHRHRLPILLLVAAVVILLAGAAFAALESNVVSSYWQGVWWAISLMTTVGFVGETPETAGGRILSAALMISGFALLTLTTAAIASLFVREEERPLEESERAFEAVIVARFDELATRLDAIERSLAERPAPPPADGP